ncbi:MAG: hypothetical protein KJ067_19695 [Vicinamibacteria bacterium]|nr:hypothetical protein [Vicinamibacteria bacterium]MCL4821366.1 hypothetical protein [Vicinamibacteria bacterium]
MSVVEAGIRVIALVGGMNTLLWIWVLPVVVVPEPVARSWQTLTTWGTASLLVATWFGLVFHRAENRLRLFLFSIFGGPFGPWCVWACLTKQDAGGPGAGPVAIATLGAAWILHGISLAAASLLNVGIAGLIATVLFVVTRKSRGQRFGPVWLLLLIIVLMANWIR